MYNRKLSQKETRLNSLIIICNHLRNEAQYRPEVVKVLYHYEQLLNNLSNEMEITYVRTLKPNKVTNKQKVYQE